MNNKRSGDFQKVRDCVEQLAGLIKSLPKGSFDKGLARFTPEDSRHVDRLVVSLAGELNSVKLDMEDLTEFLLESRMRPTRRPSVVPAALSEAWHRNAIDGAKGELS